MGMEARVRIREETVAELEQYRQVPIVFTVKSQYRAELIDQGLGGWSLIEEAVEPSYEKDYDEATPPTRWHGHGDISNWVVFAAYDGSARVGGALVAWNTPSIHMFEGRTDLAVLWDIRIRQEYRRSGIGTRLFARSVEWAKLKGCSRLKIETQNINAPACRFYARMGCELRGIHHGVYPEYPEEVQFLWYLNL